MKDQAKSELRTLTALIDQFLPALDSIMSEHSVAPVVRGERVARIANQLDMANQIAKRYGLGRGLAKRKPLVQGGRLADAAGKQKGSAG